MDSKKPMNMACYICGRSNNDIETLISQQVVEMDGKLKHLNNDLTELTDKYSKLVQEILLSIKDSNLHDIQFNTILKDSSLRKKISISHLDAILRHFELKDDWGFYPSNDKWGSSFYQSRDKFSGKTLEDICNLFNETIKNNPEIVKIKKSISELENKKGGLAGLHLNKKQINISKSSTTIEILICPICSIMFDEASKAAWRIYDDDD